MLFLIIYLPLVVATSLFERMEERTRGLEFCDTTNYGFEFRLPQPPSCPILDLKQVPPVAVGVSEWWYNYKWDTIVAHECRSVKETIIRKESYLFVQHEEPRVTEELEISPDDCELMVKTLKSPKKDTLEEVSQGQYATQNHKIPEFGWGETNVEENINYYLRSVNISITNNGIIYTDIPLKSDCPSEKGYCYGVNGVLIWKPHNRSICNVHQGQSSTCIKTGDRITCPSTQNLYTGLKPSHTCLHNSFYTDQGVLITTYSIKKTKQRRSLNSNEIPIPNVVMDSELNSKLQYIESFLKKSEERDVNSLLHSICNNRQNVIYMATHMAAKGNPSALIQVLTGQSNYRAYVFGDVVVLRKCTNVSMYKFLRQDKMCTLEWPLLFKYKNESRKGFLKPVTGEIISEPTEINCPSPPFFFDLHNGQVADLQQQKIRNMEQIVSTDKSESFKDKGMPEIIFHSKSQYSFEDFANYKNSLLSSKNAAQQELFNSMIARGSQGFKLSQAEKSIKDKLLSALGLDWLNWKNIIIVGGVILGLILLAYLLPCIEPCLTIMLECCGQCCICLNCLCRVCKRCSKANSHKDCDDCHN